MSDCMLIASLIRCNAKRRERAALASLSDCMLIASLIRCNAKRRERAK